MLWWSVINKQVDLKFSWIFSDFYLLIPHKLLCFTFFCYRRLSRPSCADLRLSNIKKSVLFYSFLFFCCQVAYWPIVMGLRLPEDGAKLLKLRRQALTLFSTSQVVAWCSTLDVRMLYLKWPVRSQLVAHNFRWTQYDDPSRKAMANQWEYFV